MTVNIMTLCIMALISLSITTLFITTLKHLTFSITNLSQLGFGNYALVTMLRHLNLDILVLKTRLE